MLRINAITLTDFAPFKGEQRISFRPEPGVTLITGNNGRGKTWLLNAIRYALFGHVLGRTDGPRDLSRVANWETARETGVSAFKVVLEFEQDGTQYKLTRSFSSARSGPAEELLLIREASVLSQEDAHRELERVLPEQIARFFLFDGDLLRQYEELAVDPSRGEELKVAIERILGIPILTNARTDVTETMGRVNRALGAAAAANVQTQQLGANLQAAQDLLDQYRDSAEKLAADLDVLDRERVDLEEQMTRSSHAQAVLARRDTLRDERSRQFSDLDIAEAKLRARSADVWRTIVGPTIERLIEAVDSELGGLSERRRQAEAAAIAADHRRLASETGTCPTCGQSVAPGVIDIHEDAPEDVAAIEARVHAQRNRRNLLVALREVDNQTSIAEIERQIETHRVQIADLDAEITDLQDELQSAPEAELRDLALKFANVQSSFANTKDRKEQVDGAASAQETAVRQLRERLANVSGLNQARLQKKADTLEALSELYREAITHYRERLREKVEAEATDIFRHLGTEVDYDRLAINPGYGLTIVHRDGEPIPDRSAGYEHLVALALLGALQRCAPITGPVIMDSPLGRLDPEHKASVVAALPTLADQVILLAYNSEFDRDQAASALGPRLLAEKELVRVTARHTVVRDRSRT